MTQSTTEWTPERRKEQEIRREAARIALAANASPAHGLTLSNDAIAKWIDTEVDRLFPPPPPDATYGNSVHDPVNEYEYRRLSTGDWQVFNGIWWSESLRTDASVRELAAEVPLSDTACQTLIDAVLVSYLGTYVYNRNQVNLNDVRSAYTSILRNNI